MRYTIWYALSLFACIPLATNSADRNDYTAEYECKAGGRHCNIDVQKLVNQACQETITVSDSSERISQKLNGGSQFICIAPGNYINKGSLTITVSGSSSAYKVLRYTRPSDNGDEPWEQSNSDQVKIRQLQLNGSYWIIHRLTFPGIPGTSPTRRIESGQSSGFQILNRILVEGTGPGSHQGGYGQECKKGSGYRDINVQNSIFRNMGPYAPGREVIAIDFKCGSRNQRAVNNEIYDWVSHPIQLGKNCKAPCNRIKMQNTVVENNDLYVTKGLHTDCNGNYTRSGGCAASEAAISTKLTAAAGSTTKMIHNRVWGSRYTDKKICCTGSTGQVIGNYDNNEFIEFRNNIVMDTQIGINNVADNNSFVGNLFYMIRRFYPGNSSRAINQFKSHDGAKSYEIYLNTFILAGEDNAIPALSDNNADVRCNVFIESGPKRSGSPPASSIADHNAFYDTPAFSHNGTNTNVEISLADRKNSTKYSAGSIVRWDSITNCKSHKDPGCYLYVTSNAGKTTDSKPKPCTALGCSFSDGSITWKAIRGPYSFYRKLKTKPERVAIPYAQPYFESPDASACPSNYAARRGIGVDDAN